jgi:enterochelin esterase-like enzyme
MGGLQAIETGIVHLGYFRWIGAFSPGVRPAALSEEFKNALEDREKINKCLILFDIVTGDDDKIVGEDVTKFEDQLKQANVQHVYTPRRRRFDRHCGIWRQSPLRLQHPDRRRRKR